MKHKIVGNAITIGFGINSNATAAEKVASQPGTQMQMDSKSMDNMMNSSDMQKQCAEMLKNPEMQKSMLVMMKTPEIQTNVKQMLQNNPEMLQMMKDLINSIEIGSTAADSAVSTTD